MNTLWTNNSFTNFRCYSFSFIVFVCCFITLFILKIHSPPPPWIRQWDTSFPHTCIFFTPFIQPINSSRDNTDLPKRLEKKFICSQCYIYVYNSSSQIRVKMYTHPPPLPKQAIFADRRLLRRWFYKFEYLIWERERERERERVM